MALRPFFHASLVLSFVALLEMRCASPQTSESLDPVARETAGSASEAPPARIASDSPVPEVDDAGTMANESAPSAAQIRTPSQQSQPPTHPPHEENLPVQDEPQQVAVVPAHPSPTRPDPMHGRFTLDQATAGLAPGNELIADIETSMGTFACALMQNEAPATVANFVGLARGVRDFWDPSAGRWTRRPFYDGSVLHRVIPEFMIQGGDILRSGRGGPGYSIHDENVTDHDAAGLLCMANAGPNTGGAQFFITEIGLPRLNGSYSVFGHCTPIDLVRRIARVPRSPRDQPIAPVYIQHVTIHR